jgi:shikimate kinase
MNIFLIGFMGSGKTATGRKLAHRIGYRFIDMDSLIEEQEGMSISTIFNKMGEAEFRKMERETLEKLILKDRLVVSTGGGVPCEPGNMDLINRHGISVYLKMDPSDLYERLKTRQSARPLIRDLSGPELRQYISIKLSERESYYSKAKYTVDGSRRDVEEIIRIAGI